MRLRRQTPAVVLLALVAGLLLTSTVIGKSKRTIVHDPRGDGGAFMPHTHPRVCDVIEATSELAKEGHLRHTVTVRGRINLGLNAPPVIITNHRLHGSNIGLASFILSPGEPNVWSHLRNHRHTVVYFVKRSVIAHAVDRRDKYFWVVDQCPIHSDRAPNHGSPAQALKAQRGRHAVHHHPV
jgi:hypothetical protein